jgi:hypothetical protein
MSRQLRPFGARVVLEADDERVLAACDAALVRYPATAGVSGELTVRARTGQDGPEDPAWPRTTASFADGHLELRCGNGVLHADGPAGHAELTLPPALLDVPDALRMFVEGAVWTLLIDGGRLLAAHAALVVERGRGLLLRGASGAGKSTLTYACLRAGFSVASDDWVYAVPGRPLDRLWGYPWRLFLVPEAADRFPELFGRPPVLHPGADTLKVPIEPPVRRRRRSAPVDAVVFLDPEPRLALRSVGLEEAAARFLASALPSEREGLPSEFIRTLLDRPCYVLQRGTSPDEAASLLRELARSSL